MLPLDFFSVTILSFILSSEFVCLAFAAQLFSKQKQLIIKISSDFLVVRNLLSV